MHVSDGIAASRWWTLAELDVAEEAISQAGLAQAWSFRRLLAGLELTEAAEPPKVQGRCLMPLMKLDRSRSGSPVAGCGKAAEELPVHDHDLAPGQMGAQTEVGAGGSEADVGVGVAQDVEVLGVVEDVLVAVGRVVEEDALVALDEGVPDRVVSSVTVRRMKMTGVAHRTISSTALGATAVEVRLPTGRAGRGAR